MKRKLVLQYGEHIGIETNELSSQMSSQAKRREVRNTKCQESGIHNKLFSSS